MTRVIKRTTILKAEGDVILQRVETLTSDNMVAAAHLALITPRLDQCRQFSDLKLAARTFHAEVKACKAAAS